MTDCGRVERELLRDVVPAHAVAMVGGNGTVKQKTDGGWSCVAVGRESVPVESTLQKSTELGDMKGVKFVEYRDWADRH
jgi:hypothetical protein